MKTEVLNNDLATVRVNVEDLEETAQEVVEVVRNNPVILITVAVVGVAAGFAAGWKIAKNHISVEYEERLEEEIAAAKEHYQRASKTGAYSTPEQAAESLLGADAVAALREYRGQSLAPEDEATVESSEADGTIMVTNNVFLRAQSDWDYDTELERRDETKPYVISHEEFLENEPDHTQSSLTYYEGDDTLCAEDDSIVSDVEGVVGADNLERFGDGSGDKSVVYIRNPVTSMDFEVLRSTDKYTRAVLNYIEHAEPRGKTRRFRDTDD